jgi:hypothetical protein
MKNRSLLVIWSSDRGSLPARHGQAGCLIGSSQKAAAITLDFFGHWSVSNWFQRSGRRDLRIYNRLAVQLVYHHPSSIGGYLQRHLEIGGILDARILYSQGV